MEPVSTTVNLTELMGGAFEAAAAQIMSSIGIILPIALPILGISVAIGFAVKFFKKITSKAG